MFLTDALKSLGRKRVADVTGLSISMVNKWFLKGENRKTPDINSLVAIADVLELDNDELGELTRDTACVRAEIEISKLQSGDDPTRRQGSIVAKLFRSQLGQEETPAPAPTPYEEKRSEVKIRRQERAVREAEEQRSQQLQNMLEKLQKNGG